MSDTDTSGSFRGKKINFTQVSNSALRDNNLSLKAKCLYSLIQSYVTIPDFTLYKGYLISICREKEKAFDSAWKELKVNGYLKQYRIPKGKNDSFVYEYDLLDIADLTTPSLINLNKNGEEIESSKDENSHTPHLVPYANGTLCEAHPMPNGGDINNTDLSNIDLNYIESKSCQSQTGQMTATGDHESTQIGLSDIKKEPPNPSVQSNGLKTHQKSGTTIKDDYTENKKIIFTDDYTEYEKIIKANISYDELIQVYPNQQNTINELVNAILDVICTKGETVKINGEKKPRNMVKSVYMELNYSDIEHILDQFKSQRHKITHLHSYLKTMLYTVRQEHSHYYDNAVRADGLV